MRSNPASVQTSDGPASGQIAIDTTNGSITYTPSANFTGTDTFKYIVCDLAAPPLCSAKATVRVVVSPPINQPPTAVDDNAAAQQNAPVIINVLGNDSDPEGALDPNSVTVVNAPAHGQAVKNGNNTITYTPASSYLGGDSFTYRVCDSAATPLCDSATVTITVTAKPNEPPVAVNDAAATLQGQAVTIVVLGNDRDPDGVLNPASVKIKSGPSHGQAQASANGSLRYTPAPAYLGADSLTYEVCDSASTPLCATATVTVSVSAKPNQAPVAVNDNAATQSNRPVSINVLNNDSDPDGALAPSSLLVTVAPDNGDAQVISAAITYTPTVDFVGGDSFTYRVCDNAAVPAM